MSKQIRVGGVAVGGGAPVSIQSMCNTATENVEATVQQILRLEQAGCEIIRVAVPTEEAARAIPAIKTRIHIPLVAVNLAVMNLLPLPALDGGRIFFLLVNAVAMLLFKKKIPSKYENYIHFAGLILLLALMVVLVFSDVGKLIH